ncbi:MAG: S41 family peptidase [Chloroflexi bacterium]|jgi:carboxyl-terminal processing protease|nr:S41 family peptidase [Chloroflexota bacterium]
MFWSEFNGETPLRRAALRGTQLIAVLVALLVTAFSAFVAGYVVALSGAQGKLSLAEEVWRLTDRYFYYEKPAEKDRLYGAITGLLATFQDPHTLFLPPQSAERERAVMSGQQGGVGIIVTQTEDKRFVVAEVRRGWAYERAGGRVGDQIVAVDGESVAEWTLNQLVERVRGALGTQVRLTVKREGEPEPITLTMTRQQINVYSEMLDGQIAYLTFTQFTSTAPSEIKTQLESLLAQRPRALILDLRNNGGGFLDEAIQIADLFLDEGLVAIERTSSGEVKHFRSRSGDLAESVPMVVLVNRGSASASEIVAGALQDRGRAVLIGQQTFGKGSVQRLFTLSDGSQLRVTQGAWYTPSERPIERRGGAQGGLQPDIAVEPSGDGGRSKGDPTLEAALAYIRRNF